MTSGRGRLTVAGVAKVVGGEVLEGVVEAVRWGVGRPAGSGAGGASN